MTSISRIRCVACGSEQEKPPADQPAVCAICGQPLAPTASGDTPTATSRAVPLKTGRPELDTFDVSEGVPEGTSLKETAASLRAEAHGRQAEQISEILRADKRLASIAALIPVWGLYRLWRSDLHSPAEKVGYSVLSLTVTFAIVAAVWLTLPGPVDRAVAAHARIEQQLNVLVDLAEQYRKEYKSYPDDEAWKRSAARADLRFYDPWARVYIFDRTSDGFAIGTYGRDGQPGGEGEDQDVFITRRSRSAESASSQAQGSAERR